MLRRCVWSRNIKNRCSIYIYDISRLRVNRIKKIACFRYLCRTDVWLFFTQTLTLCNWEILGSNLKPAAEYPAFLVFLTEERRPICIRVFEFIRHYYIPHFFYYFFSRLKHGLFERYEGIWGSGVVALLIHNLGYRFRSASFPGHFTLQGKSARCPLNERLGGTYSPCIHWTKSHLLLPGVETKLSVNDAHIYGICTFTLCTCRYVGQFKQINQPDASISQIYCLSFKYSSTCFGHPHAHHQELINCSSRLWFTVRAWW